MAVIDHRWKRVLAFASIYLIWGSTYLAIRYGIESFAPYRMMGTRSLIAGSILYLWGRRQSSERLSWVHWRAAFVVGALFFLGGHGCLAWAERHIPSGVASLLVATIPVWLALFEVASGRIRLTSRLVLGLALGFAGVLLLTEPAQLLPGESMDIFAAAVVLASATSWAIGTIVSRKLTLPRSPFLSSGMSLLGGGSLLLAVSFAAGESPPSGGVSWLSIAAVAYLIVFGSIVGLVAYMWLLSVETASKVGTYAFVNPGIAVFLGWLAGGESLSGRILLATALMVSGVAILVTSKEEKQHDRSPVARTDAARESG
ncbi:MAG TPA: EamA family transporter [Vicinamibacteria bacterium]|nr:EamA family transporter [Vicinamibacteria bacterium]